jgi:hypothetical protein
VSDDATGVEPDNMRQCFLSAGNKTASDTSRGFFSTGAKNITIFGDVHYTSVTNSKLSKVYLDDMSYGHIVTYDSLDSLDTTKVPEVIGVDITQTQRNVLNVQNNGLNSVLIYTNQTEIEKYNTLEKIDTMLNSLGKIATLRDIFSDPTYSVYRDIHSYAPHVDILNTGTYVSKVIHTDHLQYDPLTNSDNYGGKYYKRVTYQYPQGNLILDTTFNVPNYPHYQARFVIKKASIPIEQPDRENQMEFGFLIKDSKAIHEVNTLGENDRYRWNPNINYLYGYVECEGFNEELNRYDREETKELIIDPNRVGGINYSHPLYVSILSVCLPRLELAIRNVQSDTSFKSININELDAIVQELENMGVNIFDDSDITFNFTPDGEGALAVSLKETENHIVKEISNETNLKLVTGDNLVLEELERRVDETGESENYVFYYDGDNEIQSIETDGPAINIDNNALQDLVDSMDSMAVDKPFIYRLDEGEWSKVEIYQRGKIDRIEDHDDSLIKIKHKSLTIQFINDINYKEKYIIDTTSGMTVKINMHNEVVASKLAKTKIDAFESQEYSFKLSDEASYDALNFLETLMSAAFTDIIVRNDIMNGKIIMDSNSISNGKKVIEYWNKVQANIEGRINQLFAQFIAKKKQIMMDDVHNSVSAAKQGIMNLFLSGTANAETVEQGADQLAVAIENAVYAIIEK